jgi:hypothetical protein
MHKLLPESNSERHRRFPALPRDRNECKRTLPGMAKKLD